MVHIINQYTLWVVTVPPVAEKFRSQKLYSIGGGFNPWSRLSTQPFEVFRGFLQNLRKYRLGSLKNDTHGEYHLEIICDKKTHTKCCFMK